MIVLCFAGKLYFLDKSKLFMYIYFKLNPFAAFIFLLVDILNFLRKNYDFFTDCIGGKRRKVGKEEERHARQVNRIVVRKKITDNVNNDQR